MIKLKVAVIDYGMGNIRSVQNAFVRLGCDVTLAKSAAGLATAEVLILPGVGAFGEAMNNLVRMRLVEPILEAAHAGKPMLGICLGMQLLAESSEERGLHTGLSLIPGRVKMVPVPKGWRLPHVGWNSVRIKQRDPLFSDAREGESFYFVHSFHFDCDPEYISATTDYGGPVIAAVQRGRVFGVQFHPERSQVNVGLRLLGNLLKHVRSQGQMAVVSCPRLD